MQLFSQHKQILYNAKRLLTLAWETDPVTTFFYYGTAVLGALVPLTAAYALKLLLDSLQGAHDAALTAVPLMVAFFLFLRYGVGLFDGVVFWGVNKSYLDYVFRYELQNELTWRYQKKLSSLDIAHFEDPKVQDLMAKTRSTLQWQLPDFLRGVSGLTRDAVAFIAAFIVLIPFGWWVPVLVSIVAVPRLVLQAKYGAIKWSLWGSGAPQVRKLWYLNGLLQDPMTVRETRIAQSAEMLLKKFASVQEYLYQLNKKTLDRYLRVLVFPPLIETAVVFAVAYLFLAPTIAGVYTIGSFLLLVSMLEQLGSRAAAASQQFAHLLEGNLYAQHYFDFLSLPPLLAVHTHPVSLGAVRPPRIEFRDVSFSYPSGTSVLKHVSFTIEPGESVALVGHNGAGKSTIVKLLCRFYDPTEGQVLINGIDLKELSLGEWYQFIGTLFQDFVHYHFTVRENILLGSAHPKGEEALQHAARRAGAAEFIEKLTGTYDQVLGTEFEDGVELSGGQWQKLAIARAFYEEPPVLILDEPTSAIDAAAEYEIFNNLEAQYRDKTLLLVSHRFSTVRNAQKIIVLEGGTILEMGTHEELMQNGKEYARLFTLQAEAYQ